MISRKEALKRLDLPDDASVYDIERRYTMISKSLRGKSDPATYERIDSITEAYDVLTGRYVEKPPVDPKMEKVILGKKRKDWSNIWHYGKIPLLVGIIVIGLIISVIYQVTHNPSLDLQVSVFGYFAQSNNPLEENANLFEDLIKKQNPALSHINVAFNPISYNSKTRVDPQLEAGALMRRMLALTGAEPVDILILDEIQFDIFAAEGIVLPLDEIFNAIEEKYPELIEQGFIKPVYYTLDQEILPEGVIAEEHIYAFDLSEKQVLNSLDLVSDSQFLVHCFHSENPEHAKAVIQNLLESIDDWYKEDQTIVDFSEARIIEEPSESSIATNEGSSQN